ncbi:D-aminoacyl-tRNA deacylase [Sutcliffiella rhizosphaerae]|uniref:D-aminoacyl-tRNA deacylase n=1 Tax=Sutcliffiella rhizosphaerae TaxID=2880967 RepID=A0ABM8YHT7_9BACI|nr:D-aminoacyl-tRNA deacylase [Sutcliffiella rhizosphaerae]CAG9619458.1 D-aminoacyl-tRNA deacylase [Sutcliffiella rhizosphaerae]
MRVVLQKAKRGEVRVEGATVGKIDKGLMLLVGVTHEDSLEDAAYVAEKVINLRIFDDENGKMNLSLLDVGGQVLSVSQFTLYGDCRKGRRPNFMAAAKPDYAEKVYNAFNQELRNKGLEVETGQFGAMMEVDFVNDGPVTLIVESK